MKKINLLITTLLLSLSVFAQGHLTFKGLEINGSLAEFSAQLSSMGYTLFYTNDSGDAKVFKGPFAGYDDCKIFVLATPKTKTVWKVAVNFPEQKSWSTLKSMYNNYKVSLTNKYGDPASDYHFFSKPYYEGDGYEFQALRNEKCFYTAMFENDLGDILIEIDDKDYNSGQVCISYEDKINGELRQSEKQQNINNDL